jgi:hypothetical protein
MRSLKLHGSEREFLNINLYDILNALRIGRNLKWSVLAIQASGNLEIPMQAFENQVNRSDRGLLIGWTELLKLSERFDQITNILLIGNKKAAALRRYDTEEEMRSSVDVVIELVDSSFWELHSRLNHVLDEMESSLS